MTKVFACRFPAILQWKKEISRIHQQPQHEVVKIDVGIIKHFKWRMEDKNSIKFKSQNLCSHSGVLGILITFITRVGSFWKWGGKSLQRLLGSAFLGFVRYGRELVEPYLAAIWGKLKILAFCWYTIKAIEACIVGKNGMIGCKNAEPSNGKGL